MYSGNRSLVFCVWAVVAPIPLLSPTCIVIAVSSYEFIFYCSRQAGLELICADFDGVTFHLATNPNAKNVITISVATKCGPVLKKYGADAKLKAIYGNMVVAPEAGYDATLSVDLNNLPASDAEKGPFSVSL
jgi:actin related protein 2/3 complex, subunit 2